MTNERDLSAPLLPGDVSASPASTDPLPNWEGFRELLVQEAENLSTELNHARDGEPSPHSVDWWAGAKRATEAAIEGWDERFGSGTTPLSEHSDSTRRSAAK